MRDGARHSFDRFALDGFATLEIKLACYAAHRSEGRDQKSEVRGQRSEVGLRMNEEGSLIMLPSIAPTS